MLPTAPRRSPDAFALLWTQEADGADVDTGTADHFDKIFTDDAPVYFRQAELGDDFGIIGAAELMFQ